jgi:hypothetical protein
MSQMSADAARGVGRPRTAAAKTPHRAKRKPGIHRASARALEYAGDVARRVNSRNAPVRNGFIERLGSPDATPPLATMLRGGQGGEVRLKLYLSLLWFSVRWPHETEYPARGWAGLLDLPEPDTNGARRISAGIEWLENHKFVRVDKRQGQPSKVFLLDERGAGVDYVLPWTAFDAKKADNEPTDRDDLWVLLPVGFWTKGWVGTLSAPAVAMLLVMMDEAAGSMSNERLWHSPSQAKSRFGLSPDVRSAGLRELTAAGILTMKKSSISPGVFDFRRLRNVYDLHLEQMSVEPGDAPPVGELVDVKSLADETTKIDKKLINDAVAAFRGETSAT